MDMQSVLKATFPPPAIEPDWQSELLFRLGAEPATSSEGRASQGNPHPPIIELHGALRAPGLA